MADTRQSLFGPSPEEVAMMQSQQGQQDAMAWGNIDPLRTGAVSGAMAGQAFGNMAGKLMGGQDPMQAKAQKLQAAQQEAEAQAQSMGINLASNPKDYYKVAAQTLQKYGLIDEAQNVMNIAQNHDIVERKMRVDEGTLGVQRTAAEAALIKANAVKNPTNSNILTLVPNGSTTKGSKGAVTLDMTDPAALAKARELQSQGYIDADSLPSPPSPGTTITNMPPAEKTFGQKIGEEAAKENYTSYTAARDAPISVNKAQTVIAALDDPNLIVGPGADARLAIAKGLNIAGASNEESINNTQTLVSQLADTTLSAIATSGLGTGQGFTEKDKQMLQDARAGRIPMTRETLRNISIMNIKAQRYAVEKWNNQLSNYDEDTKNTLRSVGIPTDPKPLPEIPKTKKYSDKQPIKANGKRPDSIPENVWKHMSPEDQALFK